jgi:hypothetical protein
MNLDVLMSTYDLMLSPHPAPEGKPYTLLGTPPPMIELVANAAREHRQNPAVQGLNPEEMWVSAIYYCQGVIRANLNDGRIRFTELDPGMDELRALTVGYSLPALSGSAPNVAFRFADVGTEIWNQIYTASTSSRDGLIARVAMNLEGNQPVPPPLLKVIAGHLVNESAVDAVERKKKRTWDRDTLFVLLADRVSGVCGATPSGALDSILQKPLQFKGVTVAAAAFDGLGFKIKPRRAARIFEENNGLLEGRSRYQYLLVPDFLARTSTRQSATEGSCDAPETTRRQQMETALKYVIYPDLGEA